MNSFFSDIFRFSLKTLCVSEKSRFFHPAYWGHYLDSTGPHSTCVIRVRSSFRENLLQCYCSSTSPTKMAMKYQKNLQKERISQMSTVTSVSDHPASKKSILNLKHKVFFIFVSFFVLNLSNLSSSASSCGKKSPKEPQPCILSSIQIVHNLKSI